MKYRFIREHTGLFRVGKMCQVFTVSRSGYYAWLNRTPSRRKKQDGKLQELILKIYLQGRGVYGSPRIHQQLLKEGILCSKKRVERLMQKMQLQARQKRKFKVTTDANHNLPLAEDHVRRDFSASGPNRLWVTDITYIYTREGWLYLAAIMDVYSRKIVGWSMKDRLGQELVLEALDMAVKQRGNPSSLIIHSDRGSQYAGYKYQFQLRKHGFTCSMSRKGDCYDNAAIESFFHTLKTELVFFCRYETRAQAKRDVFEYIEVFYNRIRLHSSIGYHSPEEYEKQSKAA